MIQNRVKPWPKCAQVYLSYFYFSNYFNPLSANFPKWSNTLKQFVGKFPTNCLSVFDHFVALARKGLTSKSKSKIKTSNSPKLLLILKTFSILLKKKRTMENQHLWLQSSLWMSVWNLYQILPLRREPLQLCLLIQNSSKNHKLLGLSLVWLPLLRWKAKLYLYALFFVFYLTHQITRSSASIIFIRSPPKKRRYDFFLIIFW